MAVPKKRTTLSKKRIRKNLWKKKAYFSIVQSYCLEKSRSFRWNHISPYPELRLRKK